MSNDRALKAARFLQRVTRRTGKALESVADAEMESLMPARPIPDQFKGATEQAAKKISTGTPLDPHEQFALEAIIIPDKRPAVDIVNGDYQITHPLWTSFNTGAIKSNIKKVIPSVGRVELPHHPLLPYGGTGFVVGQDLLMTNRHVAEIFCAGLGLRDLNFLPGREAGIDFLQEKGTTTPHILVVRKVMMIHPYWDMALLQVDGLPSDHFPLALSLKHPEDLLGEDVAVIGYPAFDPRNDANVQNTVFGGVYDVKRLQPGKIGERRSVASFGKNVLAATHDSSTLGGNSGSVVLSAKTGKVVGLHFAGVYLDANYAVPSAELARDGRVIDAGVISMTTRCQSLTCGTSGGNTPSQTSSRWDRQACARRRWERSGRGFRAKAETCCHWNDHRAHRSRRRERVRYYSAGNLSAPWRPRHKASRGAYPGKLANGQDQ